MKVVKSLLVVCFVMALMAGTADARISLDRAVVSNSDDVSIRLIQDEEMSLESKIESKIPVELENFGGFGGPMLQYIQLDLDTFAPMTDDRGIDEFESQMLLIGGLGGVIYKDFRFGGFGFGNGQETSGRDALGNRRSAEISMGGGGVFLEYNPAFNSRMGLALGSLIGAGGMDLEASGDDLGPDGDWNAQAGFFMAYPYLGVWAAPVEWMWVQVDAGYLYYNIDSDEDEFENDLGVEMIDGDITGGFSASLKLNFGYNPNAK